MHDQMVYDLKNSSLDFKDGLWNLTYLYSFVEIFV
jgi:hypothetical protein